MAIQNPQRMLVSAMPRKLSYLEKVSRDHALLMRSLDLAREKGCQKYFELLPKFSLPILPTDDKYVEHAKRAANGQGMTDKIFLDVGSLYMQRNATAEELAEAWKTQGWFSLIVRRSPLGHQGPKFNWKLISILNNMGDIGEWTMCPVERDWSVVFATEKPESIEVFKPLMLPKDVA